MVVVVGLVLLPFCDAVEEAEVVVLSTKVVQMFRFWRL